jgi:hypothetical protein
MRQAAISHHGREIEAMTYNENNRENLDINPTTILLGLGYAAGLCVAIGWVATLLI